MKSSTHFVVEIKAVPRKIGKNSHHKNAEDAPKSYHIGFERFLKTP